MYMKNGNLLSRKDICYLISTRQRVNGGLCSEFDGEEMKFKKDK